jgi:predicted acetyltransferase
MAGNPNLALVEPDAEYAPAFIEMAEDFQTAGESRYEPDLPLLHRNFPTYLERLGRNSRGENLPPGYVTANEFWLLERDAGQILGVIRLRHRLTPYLEERGGHIGYAIRPAARRKGYGTRMLALLLDRLRDPAWQRARGLDLRRVLITCNAENIGSARIIEANGGVLENRVWSEGELVSRYWVNLDHDG